MTNRTPTNLIRRLAGWFKSKTPGAGVAKPRAAQPHPAATPAQNREAAHPPAQGQRPEPSATPATGQTSQTGAGPDDQPEDRFKGYVPL